MGLFLISITCDNLYSVPIHFFAFSLLAKTATILQNKQTGAAGDEVDGSQGLYGQYPMIQSTEKLQREMIEISQCTLERADQMVRLFADFLYTLNVCTSSKAYESHFLCFKYENVSNELAKFY